MREVMVQYLQHRLLKWFDENHRIFPWREDRATKYQQIVSEILLQRTKAETVAKYYDTFFSKFPDWNALANASLEELEEIMKPLGLYRHRARRLYKLGEDIRRRGGRIPGDENELRDSGFIGLYVTNAFELFILKNRKPLLDVNMSRLLNLRNQKGIIPTSYLNFSNAFSGLGCGFSRFYSYFTSSLFIVHYHHKAFILHSSCIHLR